MFRNLSQFLEALKQGQDLIVIDTPTDPCLEIPEIHRRVIAANGPALLFTNVKGSSFPVVTNLFGTKERVELAFGHEPGQFIEAVAKLPEEMLPPTPAKLW